MDTRIRSLTRALVATAAVAAALYSPAFASAASPGPTATAPIRISNCSGQNAEVEQATDRARGYVYEDWMAAGCNGIAFARSTDGGKTFSNPIRVPGATGSTFNSWDPAVTVGSDGTVYASYMTGNNNNWFPVVTASHDFGMTFDQITSLQPPGQKNWGDRDFVAVDPSSPNIVYLTWDYGPNRTSVTFICAANGSCGFGTGDLNAVVQVSHDGGKSFGPIIPINPNFPAGGGDSAPIFVEPNHRVDVLYQGYPVLDSNYTLGLGHEYYSSSTDYGEHWSAPVEVGPNTDALSMSLSEWWINGALAVDSAGNLYASWDSQDPAGPDTGWLSFSTDHGQTWSPLVQVTDSVNAPHIMELTPGAKGTVYVSWLSTASPFSNALSTGYAEYLRAYSISGTSIGPVSRIVQPSGSIYGDPNTWPGDTTGLSTLASNKVVLSWGSGVPENNQPKSEIFSSVVTFGH